MVTEGYVRRNNHGEKRKGIILAALILCCQLSMSEKAYAADYYTFNDHVLVYGVGDYGSDRQKYYITPSAETYRTQITNAMSDWIYTTDRLNYTTPISYRETSEYSKSRMDIYAASKGPYVGYNAQTLFYNDNLSTGAIDKYKHSWIRNKITLNTTSESVSHMSGPQIRGVFAHEMGHCFGLDENNGNTSSIMCTWKEGRSVNKAQICDLKGINHLYK